jgi:cellulase/cellobiase CelA1
VSEELSTAQLLERAAKLTPGELVQLGKSTRKMLDFYMRPNGEWATALTSASGAAQAAGRAASIEELQAAALDAVAASVMARAESRGRDPSRVRTALAGYKQEADRKRSRRRRRAFAVLQRAFLQAVGLRVQRSIAPAILGISAAVTALGTWDLASPDGRYRPEHRRLLMTPWENVTGLSYETD